MKRIAQLRKEKRLNQTGLAIRLNVSQKMISAYENGTHQPGIETLKKMSEIFGVSVDYIIENTDIKATADQLTYGNLTKDDIEMLSLFKKLTPTKRQRAIGIVIAMNNLDE